MRPLQMRYNRVPRGPYDGGPDIDRSSGSNAEVRLIQQRGLSTNHD